MTEEKKPTNIQLCNKVERQDIGMKHPTKETDIPSPIDEGYKARMKKIESDWKDGSW